MNTPADWRAALRRELSALRLELRARIAADEAYDATINPPVPESRPTFATPALNAWRREIKAGKRKPTTFDTLWRAACWEAAALDAARAGFHDAAAEDRDTARRLVRQAVRERAA